MYKSLFGFRDNKFRSWISKLGKISRKKVTPKPEKRVRGKPMFRLPKIDIRISLGGKRKKEKVERIERVERVERVVPVTKEKPKKIKVPEMPKRPRPKHPFGDLSKMLRSWKGKKIHTTTIHEKKLETAIGRWKKESKEKKEMREYEKERKKILKQREVQRKQIEKQHRKEEKTKKKAVRKVRKKAKKAVKHEVKGIKKRIRKKQVSKSEISDLRKQIKEWRAKGYGNTASLERKLDKLERK